jgi:hypothetical protein
MTFSGKPLWIVSMTASRFFSLFTNSRWYFGRMSSWPP